MAYKIIIQIEALLKTREAFDWYQEQKEGLGYDFLKEIEICHEKLQLNPHRYSFINHQYRRIQTNRFPYILMYEIEDNTVIVTNVRHIKQKPL